MTETTKDTRRSDWAKWNFAGTIDWAVDLQSFTADDMDVPPDIPSSGDACNSGGDVTVNTGELCSFSCTFGFCPESLCQCYETGPLEPLPAEKMSDEVAAWDDFDVDLNRLCKFACKYGYCPDTICTTIANRNTWEMDGEDLLDFGSDSPMNYSDIMLSNADKCPIVKDHKYRDWSTNPCHIYCQPQIDAAQAENRTTNWGCVGFYPLDKPIPWYDSRSSPIPTAYAPGICMCDNMLMNDIADIVIEALPAIAEVSPLGLDWGIVITDSGRLAVIF
jgi:hypothetical protein